MLLPGVLLRVDRLQQLENRHLMTTGTMMMVVVVVTTTTMTMMMMVMMIKIRAMSARTL